MFKTVRHTKNYLRVKDHNFFNDDCEEEAAKLRFSFLLTATHVFLPLC